MTQFFYSSLWSCICSVTLKVPLIKRWSLALLLANNVTEMTARKLQVYALKEALFLLLWNPATPMKTAQGSLDQPTLAD